MRRVAPILLTVAGLTLAACGKEEKKAVPPRKVEAVRITPTPVRDTGEYLGSLISRQSVSILPQVGGYVRKILVRPGQKVEAGAPLLEIDARVESAALLSAQAQQGSASANAGLAQQTLARTEALYKEGLVSAQELEQARAAAEAAQATRRSASAQVSQRQVQLQYYAVRAPFGGTMGDVTVRIGDYVSGTTVLTSIAESDVLEVNAAIPSERARTLVKDAPVELLANDGSLLVTTQVYFVAPLADPRTQLVDVKAVFNNTVGLRPQELVRTRVIYGEAKKLQVPALAVTQQSGQAFVYVVENKDGKTVASRKPVKLGRLGEQKYVVEEGLENGARVVTTSIQALRDGLTIEVTDAKDDKEAKATARTESRTPTAPVQ